MSSKKIHTYMRQSFVGILKTFRKVKVGKENEIVKSFFCRVLDNVFKGKRILYMYLHCGIMREERKGCSEWEKRSFQRLVSILEKRKARWHRY